MGNWAAALGADHPAKAREIREWNSATRGAMLAVFDMGVAGGPARREFELWRVQSRERDVRCVAVYLPRGSGAAAPFEGEARAVLGGRQSAEG